MEAAVPHQEAASIFLCKGEKMKKTLLSIALLLAFAVAGCGTVKSIFLANDFTITRNQYTYAWLSFQESTWDTLRVKAQLELKGEEEIYLLHFIYSQKKNVKKPFEPVLKDIKTLFTLNGKEELALTKEMIVARDYKIEEITVTKDLRFHANVIYRVTPEMMKALAFAKILRLQVDPETEPVDAYTENTGTLKEEDLAKLKIFYEKTQNTQFKKELAEAPLEQK